MAALACLVQLICAVNGAREHFEMRSRRPNRRASKARTSERGNETSRRSKPNADPTTGQPAPTKKRYGIISETEGLAYSQKGTNLTFGYLRTASGLPPEIEKKRRH